MDSSTLREYRKSLGLRQEDVADQMGISTSRYSQIESDPSGVTVEQVRKLGDIFSGAYRDIFFSKVFSGTNNA